MEGWDGVILAAITDEAGEALPGGDELAAAVAEIDRLREISLFDVALVTQGRCTRETTEMCRRPASHGSWSRSGIMRSRPSDDAGPFALQPPSREA